LTTLITAGVVNVLLVVSLFACLRLWRLVSA
jgi:hypothetical protein